MGDQVHALAALFSGKAIYTHFMGRRMSFRAVLKPVEKRKTPPPPGSQTPIC
jgi:hypothetical protein